MIAVPISETDLFNISNVERYSHEVLVRKRADYLISKHKQKISPYQIKFADMDMTIMPDVFCPIYGEGSILLANAISVDPGEKVLDIGTGSGALALLAAKMGASVVATDISEKAVFCASRNASSLGLLSRVENRQGDLFKCISKDEMFSLVIFNMPFMEGIASDDLQLAMYDRGWNTLKNFLSGLKGHLSTNGRALVAYSNCGNIELLHEQCRLNELNINEVACLGFELKFYSYEITRA